MPLISLGRRISRTAGRTDFPAITTDVKEEEIAVVEVGERAKELEDRLGKQGKKISLDFISEMTEVFCYFDRDKKGYLPSKDMPTILRAMGWNPTLKELHDILAEVDVNHDGKMDLGEFVTMMHNHVGDPDTMEEIRIAFRVFDTDGDGQISKEEFRICMLNFGEKFDEEDLDVMFRLADKGNQGFIDFDEFVNMITFVENNSTINVEHYTEAWRRSNRSAVYSTI